MRKEEARRNGKEAERGGEGEREWDGMGKMGGEEKKTGFFYCLLIRAPDTGNRSSQSLTISAVLIAVSVTVSSL